MVLISKKKKNNNHIFKAAAVFKERFSLLGNAFWFLQDIYLSFKKSKHYSWHTDLTWNMQCFENRYSSQEGLYHRVIVLTHVQQRDSCPLMGRWGFNKNLLRFSSTGLRSLHRRGSGCIKCFSLNASFNQHQRNFTSKCTNSPFKWFNFITYPTNQQELAPCLRQWLVDRETAISILTGCILFLAV